jgi:hypothetical protein
MKPEHSSFAIGEVKRPCIIIGNHVEVLDCCLGFIHEQEQAKEKIKEATTRCLVLF